MLDPVTVESRQAPVGRADTREKGSVAGWSRS